MLFPFVSPKKRKTLEIQKNVRFRAACHLDQFRSVFWKKSRTGIVPKFKWRKRIKVYTIIYIWWSYMIYKCLKGGTVEFFHWSQEHVTPFLEDAPKITLVFLKHILLFPIVRKVKIGMVSQLDSWSPYSKSSRYRIGMACCFFFGGGEQGLAEE